jgi:hypothetical protein
VLRHSVVTRRYTLRVGGCQLADLPLYSPKCLEGVFPEVRVYSVLLVYLFQNAGESSARTVKISSLPRSMQTVSTTRPKGLTISKLSDAPT